MAKNLNKDLEELLKENSHIVDLHNKIGDVCDGKKLGDIESALIMFLSDIYMIHLDHETAVDKCNLFNNRMIALLNAFREAKDKYKGRYVV